MEPKQKTKSSPGVWKKDPRGVEYVTFTMPTNNPDDHTTFEFVSPKKKDNVIVAVSNSSEILGVIVLLKPNYGKEN